MFIFPKKVLPGFTENDIGLVKSIAKRYQVLCVEKDDLIQAGFIGLLRAQRKFSVQKNVKFSTYASYWIKNEIIREIQKNSEVNVPAYMLSKIRKLSIESDNLATIR